MRVRILDPAERDLENGYRFYERQSSGLGFYVAVHGLKLEIGK